MANYFWVVVEKFGGVLLKLIGTILLARVLTPSDFGLFGMIFVLSSLGQVLVDSGMGGALIKKHTPDEKDYTTVFTFNLAVSAAIWLLFYALSPVISDFYDEQRLNDLIPLLVLTLVIRSLTLVPVARLTKQLNFKIQSALTLSSYIIAFFVGYALAISGYGVLALVYMSITEAVVFCCSIYIYSKYLPKIGFNKKSFKELYPFGVKLSLASVIRTCYENSLNVIIGKLFGTQLLGLYYQANKVNSIFVGTTTVVINKTAFPILAKSINEKKFVKDKMKLLLSSVCWLTFIVFVMFSTNSELIVTTAFGSQWIGSANMLSIISLAGFGMVVEALTRCYLKSYGYAGEILKLELVKSTTGIIIILLSILLEELNYLLTAYVISTIVSSVLNMLKVAELTEYSFSEQVSDISKPLISAIIVYIYIIYVHSLTDHNLIYMLLISVIFPVTIYFFLAYKDGLFRQK